MARHYVAKTPDATRRGLPTPERARYGPARMSNGADPHTLTENDGARADPRWARAALNRWIFRGMLASAGTVAVVLHRTLPWKTVAWDFAKLSARNLGRACGVSVHVHGLEHLDGTGPYVFTPNHQSHFDIAALLGHLPGHNRFVTKKELFAEPVLGMVLNTLGMIGVDREKPGDAIARFTKAAAEGSSLIIFPEGTRSRDGTLLPFKKGPFATAIELGLPIVPVVCCGTRDVMPKGGYLAIVPGDIQVYVEPPIETRGLRPDDLDSLRDRTRAVIEARLLADAQAAETSAADAG